jgi:hypothetical protein
VERYSDVRFREKIVEFNPKPPSKPCGVTLTLTRADPGILEIEVSERSGNWTRHSLATVCELSGYLDSFDEITVDLVVEPSYDQNYAVRNRLGESSGLGYPPDILEGRSFPSFCRNSANKGA